MKEITEQFNIARIGGKKYKSQEEIDAIVRTRIHMKKKYNLPLTLVEQAFDENDDVEYVECGIV